MQINRKIKIVTKPVPESLPPFEKLDRGLTKQIGVGVYRLILLLLCAANFWLAKTYVSKDDFEALKEKSVVERQKLADDLTDIKITLKLMNRQSDLLQDHEARIRILEKKP